MPTRVAVEMTRVWKEERPSLPAFFAHGGDHIPEQPHRQQTGAAGEPDARREQQHHHKGNANAAAQREVNRSPHSRR